MNDKCYDCQEILELKGTEEHLKTCKTCSELFAQSKDFIKGYEHEISALGPILATAEREKDVQKIDEALETIAISDRLDFIKTRAGVVPGMVIKLCNRSKKNLLNSPNESEQWLHLAGTVLEQLKQQSLFQPKDVQWVEAKYHVSMGSLAAARGCISQAYDAYRLAHQLYEEIGDDFQAALFALGFSFTLTKMGRSLEAKRICLESLPVLRIYGARREYLYVMNNLAMVYCAIAKRKRAEHILSILLNALDKQDEYYGMVIHNLAQLHLEEGNYNKALKYVTTMLEMARAAEMKIEEARALIIAAEIRILGEEYLEGAQELATARALLQGSGCDLDIALINVYEARIQMASGRSAETIRLLRSAITFFTTEGFVPDLIDALELWERAQAQASKDLHSVAHRAFHAARNLGRLTAEVSQPS